MSKEVQCFMLVPTNYARRWLRRYEEGDCPYKRTQGWHNEMVLAEDGPIIVANEERQTISTLQFAMDDPRWPSHCKCGHIFTAGKASKQTFYEHVYLTPDQTEVTIHPTPLEGIARAPAGAMWYADWYTWKGPDGHSLAVMLPDGYPWLVDGPASNSGKPWTRTGEPPNITAQPSIQTPKYHGWLRDGKLIEC